MAVAGLINEAPRYFRPRAPSHAFSFATGHTINKFSLINQSMPTPFSAELHFNVSKSKKRRHDMPEMESRANKISISSSRPAPDLSVDLVVDILSRLPVKSLCRFKCVSRHWHALCSDPRLGRRNLPRTLSGFFYQTIGAERFPSRHLASVDAVVSGSGHDGGRARAPVIDPAFSFLPGAERTSLLDCCGGLLLCRRWEQQGPLALTDASGLVVLNPAVQRWAALPPESAAARAVCLASDPAVSSHFHVLAFLEDESYYATGVEIYSSQTGAWSRKESGWRRRQTTLRGDANARGVFFNGMLHLLTMEAAIVAVDVEGEAWRTIALPQAARYRPMIAGVGHGGFLGMDSGGHIGVSQGQLYYLEPDGLWTLSIWVLVEDSGTEEWILKHTVTTSLLADSVSWRSGWDCHVIAVHPDGNSIFFVAGSEKTLGSYELVTKELRIIRDLGHDCESLYLAYVPFFSESM